MMRVEILLSFYEGNRYLNDQLDSIFAQSYDGPITVRIRDDGSPANNIYDVIEGYKNSDYRRIFVFRGENVGAQRSFLELLQSTGEADYYFFADQDDVWKSDHVSSAVKMLRRKNIPALYCSNYSLADRDLNIIKERVLEKTPQFTPLKAFFYNKIPGCCMAWNNKLQKYLRQMHPGNVMMHDRYVVSFASFIGEVIYDSESHILHRIHGNNVIGVGNKKIEVCSWIKEKSILLRERETYDVSEMAKEFLRVGAPIAHPEFVKDIEMLRDYRENRRNTQKLLKHPDTFDNNRGGVRSQLSIRSKIRFKLF